MKYTYILAVIIALVLVMMVTGCEKDEIIDPDIQYDNSLLPLAKGNYWTFIDTTFVNGEVDSVKVSKIGITGAEKINYRGDIFWVYHWTWYDMPENKPRRTKSLITNEEEGLIYYGQRIGASHTHFIRTLFLKYPVDEGDEWTFRSESRIECISDSTRLETDAGIFDAYVYRLRMNTRLADLLNIHITDNGYHRDERIQYLYYVPQIGYVGMKETINGEVSFIRSITEYRVIEE